MRYIKTIETREQKQSWGAVWTATIEKWASDSGKTANYVLYISRELGVSGPVGEYRSIKAARKMLDSFSGYVLVPSR